MRIPTRLRVAVQRGRPGTDDSGPAVVLSARWKQGVITGANALTGLCYTVREIGGLRVRAVGA